jgi:acyl carrier protein
MANGTMNVDNEIKQLLSSVLEIDASDFEPTTEILGAIPELDSMGVVALLTAMEETYNIVLADDEIDASVFETLGTLSDYVNSKRGNG